MTQSHLKTVLDPRGSRRHYYCFQGVIPNGPEYVRNRVPLCFSRSQTSLLAFQTFPYTGDNWQDPLTRQMAVYEDAVDARRVPSDCRTEQRACARVQEAPQGANDDAQCKIA